jgi:FKBP-type peptidyl-prolyl cis-trans isomerase (trigger factor)
MTSHDVKKLPKNSYQITVTVPWKDIEEQYKTAFDLILAQFELKGYRKGKVPADLAQKHIPKEEVYNQLIHSYMPKIYEEVITKEGIKPIISPRIDLKSAKENEDWVIEFQVAERPTVNLKNYKEAVKKATAGAKKADIWVPGKDAKDEQTAAKEKAENDQKVLNEALNAVLKEVDIEVSDLVIEEELNQRLSRLVDDIQKLGLTTDSYLKSKNITMEDLKAQYTRELQEMYKMEFTLMAIAEQEKIMVEQADLEKLFAGISDEKERAEAQKNAYFYASILRKQKTLDFLTSL